MDTFIGKTAEYILEHFSDELDEVLVVFPNRRPAIYLQEELKMRCQKAVWMPEIQSVDDFVFQQLSWRKAENVEMLLDLFAVHQEVEIDNKQGFDRFIGWARILLSDFNELDLYLANHQHVFSYLEDAKNIANWRADGSPLSELEQSYVSFFGSLEAYYVKFKEKLQSKNMAWQGLAYRTLAESLERYPLHYKHLVFAGFNALTPAEEKMFKYYHQYHKATILWDADHYYLDDVKHEAGNYMRYNLKEFPKAKSWVGDYFQSEKDFQLHAMAGSVSQAKLAGKILQDRYSSSKEQHDSVAIILPDEELLIPLLSSLPSELDYNVTMSLPIKNSLSYKWVMDMLDYYLDSKNELEEASQQAYTKHIEKLLLHPLMQDFCRSFQTRSEDLLQALLRTNLLFVDEVTIDQTWKFADENLLERLKQLLFAKPKSVDLVLKQLLSFLKDLKESSAPKLDRIESEVVLKVFEIFDFISKIIHDNRIPLSLHNIRVLFMQLISMESLPFKGEPLQGVQIMGMLESRNLDFDTLIILSANEGVLPRSSPYQSFLLFELRKELGLPLPREKDDIFAYHFYRLMQRASTIHLLYNTETDGMGDGEASRYIKQLEYELHQKTNNKLAAPSVYSPKLILESNPEIRISKTPEMIDQIMHRFEKGFSASSLSQYAHCQLQFYFSKVIGVRENTMIEEVIPPNVLGSIVHDTLEDIYKPHFNEILSEDIVKQAFKKLDPILESQISKHYSEAAISLGKNILLEQVVRKLLNNVKKVDSKCAKTQQLQFVSAEEDFKRDIQIHVNGVDYQVPFYGIIDRIDKLDNVLRFVDYKTGRVESSSLNVEEGNLQVDFFGIEKPAKKMAFQLLMYAWLYQVDQPFKGSIMSLKKGAKHEVLQYNKSQDISLEVMDEFEEVLSNLMEDMLDLSKEFVQTPHTKHCQFCDYAHICQRS
jgi:CRISPR/Cas system-associated exonuclease Cas4 (RecB family)